MHPLSIPVLVMAGVLLFVGLEYLLIYVRGRDGRENLALALLCLAVSAYDLCAVRLYDAESFAEGVFWQRWQVAVLSMVGLAFVWFMHCYTRRGTRAALLALGIPYGLCALLLPWVGWPWGYSATHPAPRTVTLGDITEITYYEGRAGVLPVVLVVTGLIAFIYTFQLLWACHRLDQRRHVRTMMLGTGLFFAGVVNDMAVSLDLYEFIYLIEYSYMFLIIAGIYSLTSDYLETKEALELSRARLQSIFAAARDVGLVLTEAGPAGERIVEFSPGAERIFGCHRSHMLGRSLETLGSPEHSPVLDRDTARDAREITLRRANGEDFPALYSRHRLSAADVPSGHVAVIVDISRRREAIEAMRRSEERLQFALAATDDGLWDLQLDAGSGHFSGRLCSMLGYAADSIEVTGRANWEQLLHPEDRDEFLAAFDAEVAADTGGFACEVRLRTAEGDYRWVLVRGKVVQRDRDGAALRMTGTHVDLSERKRIEQEQREFEQQVQRAQKLESLGVLAGGIAHDFNNLLTAIIGNADLALDDLPEDAPGREAVGEIKTSAASAAELTAQLLAYCGRTHIRAEALDLKNVINEMGHLLRLTVGKNVNLRHSLSDHLPPVLGDAGQISQVLVNLVTNAAEAIGEGQEGDVTIAVRGVRIAEEYVPISRPPHPLRPGIYVLIEIMDNGEGMSGEVLERIFEPFFSTKFAGRGLGLPAVSGIVHGHRGGIDVRTRPGEGTRVSVYLPALEAPAPRQDRGQYKTAQLRRQPVILVADDENAVRRILERMLKRFGYHVIVTADGQECLDRFREDPEGVDLVILDMTMPRLNGEETFFAIHEARPELPVLLASGYSEAEATGGLSGHGIAGFLAKPFEMDQLRSAVDAILK